jgi:hypothetical protein
LGGCPPWILPHFDTHTKISRLLISHGVRSVE